MKLVILLLHPIKIVILFSTLLFSLESVLSAYSKYEACVARNCGTGPNISYPFYIKDAGEEFCGQPGFEVVCQENKPIFWTSRGSYIIEEISYKNKSIRLVDKEVRNTTCFAPSHYFSFRLSFLKFSSHHADLQFFYGCDGSFRLNSLEKTLIPCKSVNESYSSFVALVLKNENLSDGEGCESEVAVPVDLELGERYYNKTRTSNLEYVKLLKNGFTLEWSGHVCSKCRTSGGRCGYEDGVSVCFCPDGTRPSDCTKGKLRNVIIKVGIAITVAAIGVLLLIITFCLLKRKYSNISKFIFFWKQNQSHHDVEAFLRNYSPFLVRRYNYLDVKKMTNSFSDKLGQGGYGSVYKGKLRDGRFVAVKVLSKLKGNGEEFINEVATISRTSHVNVVTLLGFCYEGHKRALIYEFMPNGSLEKFIFDENPQSNNHNKLGWELLYQISLGIARGLEYLHRGCNTRILHFDIKPHNILLDENFLPKISDFGLARVCTREESIISMLSARGTAGYIAPEVFCRNFGGVSHKSDVYSYGMMVLEMVGGRKNINVGGNTSEIYFPHWIYKRIELNEELGLKRIVDEEDQIKVKKMIMVSLWCIQTDPLNRPAMTEVIEMLEGNLDSLQVPPTPFLSSSP